MGMDSQFQNGTIHVHCQTLDPTAGGGADVKVETSFDTVEANQIGTTINVSAPGSQSAAITSNIASMVRLKIENQQSASESRRLLAHPRHQFFFAKPPRCELPDGRYGLDLRGLERPPAEP